MKKTIALMTLLLTLLGAAALAADAGTQRDPLVTLSYLNDTYLPHILSQVDQQLEERDAALVESLSKAPDAGGSSSVYRTVTLEKGQTLTVEAGGEILLREGAAVCVADSAPGLVDMTSGGSLEGGGSLTQNHLYLMTVPERGIRADSPVTLLVRGGYTVS